tara:strand:+ start:275 stop:604 length:330 start_codon:yes stop_codon:yes gene_type:complete
MAKHGWREFSNDVDLRKNKGLPEGTQTRILPHTVRVQTTRSGKKGKTVTLIHGLEMDRANLKMLLKKLKTFIGSGGTSKNGVIELQGDQVEKALLLLIKEGFKPKRVGG